MAFILSFETSTSVCSAAVHENGIVKAATEIHIEQSHGSKLAVLIDRVKDLAGISLNQLSAIAITSGPGSYTGLRIGTSTAKGLCYALDLPLIAVSSLEVMAYSVITTQPDDALYCPMIDARRMEVYCMVTDRNLNPVETIQAKVIDEDSFREHLKNNRVLFFGDGAEKCKSIIKHPRAFYIPAVYPSAVHLGALAYHKYMTGNFEDLVTFEPFYLKEFMTKKPVS
jgi:tRNA threonylcarbamoyladenosine biosynthesis protein TsaB